MIKKAELFKYLLCIVIIGFSSISLIGNFNNYYHLSSWSPDWVTMKNVTAYLTLLSALLVANSIENKKRCYECMVIVSTLIAITTVYIIAAFVFNQSAVSFIPISSRGANTIAPGVPCWCAVIGLFLLAIHPLKKMRYIGTVISFIGALPILGYVFNIQILTYYYPGYSTAMAMPTAIILFLLGGWVNLENQFNFKLRLINGFASLWVNGASIPLAKILGMPLNTLIEIKPGLEIIIYEKTDLSFGVTCTMDGVKMDLHEHPDYFEIFKVIEGEFTDRKTGRVFKTGDTVLYRPGEYHEPVSFSKCLLDISGHHISLQ